MISMQAAMTELDWELRDLFINALQYGDVGTEADVRRHLESGHHLTGAQTAVLIATLDDALMAARAPFRVDDGRRMGGRTDVDS
jgi:hypothetical protein